MTFNDGINSKFDYRWLDIFLARLSPREEAIIRQTVLCQYHKANKRLAKIYKISESRVIAIRRRALDKLVNEVQAVREIDKKRAADQNNPPPHDIN